MNRLADRQDTQRDRQTDIDALVKTWAVEQGQHFENQLFVDMSAVGMDGRRDGRANQKRIVFSEDALSYLLEDFSIR